MAGQLSMVQWLMSLSCNIDAADSRGQTALIAATACGHRTVVEELLAAPCDVLATDCRSSCPFQNVKAVITYDILQAARRVARRGGSLRRSAAVAASAPQVRSTSAGFTTCHCVEVRDCCAVLRYSMQPIPTVSHLCCLPYIPRSPARPLKTTNILKRCKHRAPVCSWRRTPSLQP